MGIMSEQSRSTNKWITVIDKRGQLYRGEMIPGKKSKSFRGQVLVRTIGGSIHCGRKYDQKLDNNLKGIKKS